MALNVPNMQGWEQTGKGWRGTAYNEMYSGKPLDPMEQHACHERSRKIAHQ
jgi:hypothetical protein